MPEEPKLESYLASLDRALGQIPVSDRADIVTEIKSHILDAKNNQPEASLDSILASLGEPETVANRYLIERGLKPGKPPKSPMIKWLTLGFLGTLTIFFIFTGILLWKFTPVISVDEERDRVMILGGLIDVDGKAGTVKVGSTLMEADKQSQTFSGIKKYDQSIEEMQIPFNNGKIDIQPSLDQTIRWNCKIPIILADTIVHEEDGKFILDLKRTNGAKCKVDIPSGLALVVRGSNGKLKLDRPRGPVDISIANGKVDITPDKNQKYRFDTKVTNGRIDSFESSDAKDSLEIKVAVINGLIRND